MRKIFDEIVNGIDIDYQTRCSHYKSELDIIAIKFKCCLQWYPCIECHAALADHLPEVWPKTEFTNRAILCGACGHQFSVAEYILSESICTNCAAKFNPGCANHHHLYFERDKKST